MIADVELIQVPEWADFLWLRHGFSARGGGHTTVYGGGDLNLGFTAADSRECVLLNRETAIAAVATGAALATVRQVHGVEVIAVDAASEPVEADGMMTNRMGLLLGIQVADCVPLLLADTRLRAVAAVHAGWRGTVGGIASNAVARLGEKFGSQAKDLVAAIGPSIGPCCYSVGEELIQRVGWDSGLLECREDAIYFDLWEANRRQLRSAGVMNIQVLGLCTACSRSAGQHRFFSHRAEAGVTGRAMGIIGLSL